MRNVVSFWLLLWFAVESNRGELVRYDGYKLLRVKPRHQRDVEAIKRIYDASGERMDFWKEPRLGGHEVDIMVPPAHEDYVRHLLKRDGLAARSVIDDIQKAIDEQMGTNRPIDDEVAEFFESYQNMSAINEWMIELSEEYPDVVSMFELGKSFEGRSINCLKLGSSVSSSAAKPAVFILGGLHAREWISPATVMFMASELVVGYNEDIEITDLLDGLDWFFLPVANVDGYVYTWEKERLWRKTRSTRPGNRCVGADPNRNWGFHWGVSGSSTLSCVETYGGPFAFSEVEVKQLADFLTDLSEKQPLTTFIDFHAYDQSWMTPYGYGMKLPENFEEQYYLALEATDALWRVNKTDYNVGSIALVIYKASGNSVDWVHASLGVPFTYAVELPDTGEHGFMLPSSYIVPIGKETFEAVKVVGHGSMEYVWPATAEPSALSSSSKNQSLATAWFAYACIRVLCLVAKLFV